MADQNIIKFLDFTGLQTFWNKITNHISETLKNYYNKTEVFSKEETYHQEVIDEKIKNVIFIGTMKDYEEAYAAGKIAVNTLVVITDQTSGSTSDATSSILGKGVLGQMILG